MSSSGQPVGQAAGAAGSAAQLQWQIPSSWQSETPSSSMRMLQATVPGSAGPAQLVGFYFGAGQGGGTEANIQRWVGQVNLAAGSQPDRGTLQANGLQVTWVEAHGELQPSTTGMGPATAQPGQGLLGAVVEGSNGPWFFKLTGPTKTVQENHDQFMQFLQSLKQS